MDTGEIAVGRAGAADERSLLDLINEIQPHVPWSSEHFRWQFLEGTGGPARLYVARTAERILSLYAVVLHAAEVDGCPVTLAMVQDVMTHPDARGQGLLHRLGALARADIVEAGDAAHTFPNERSRGSFDRNGWTDRGPVPVVRWSPASGAVTGDADVALDRVESPGELPPTWESAGLGDGIVRSSAYLDWRYARPETTYEHEVIGDGDGFLVTKWYRSAEVHRLHICDLILDQHRRELVAPVLQRIVARAADAGADVDAWCGPDHPYRPAYEAVGFVDGSDPARRVFTTGVGPGPSWHLSLGDSDVY